MKASLVRAWHVGCFSINKNLQQPEYPRSRTASLVLFARCLAKLSHLKQNMLTYPIEVISWVKMHVYKDPRKPSQRFSYCQPKHNQHNAPFKRQNPSKFASNETHQVWSTPPQNGPPKNNPCITYVLWAPDPVKSRGWFTPSYPLIGAIYRSELTPFRSGRGQRCRFCRFFWLWTYLSPDAHLDHHGSGRHRWSRAPGGTNMRQLLSCEWKYKVDSNLPHNPTTLRYVTWKGDWLGNTMLKRRRKEIHELIRNGFPIKSLGKSMDLAPMFSHM